MTEEIVNSIQKAHCARCGDVRNCDVVSHYKESGNEAEYLYWINDWRVMKCRGCDYVFLMVTKTNSEDYDEFENELGEYDQHYRETVEYWPTLSRRKRADWLYEIPAEENTKSIHVALNETYGALENDLRVLAAIGMRTTFDATASAIGVDEALPFAKKLDQLIEKGFLRQAERPQLETVIEAGSASAHRSWEPKAGDLNLLMEILENFVFEAIVAPAQKRRREKELGAVSVPKRPRKTRAKEPETDAEDVATKELKS